MIRPLLDENNKIINPTIVLCNRNKHKIGSIFPINDFEITPDLYGRKECSFSVSKYNNGVLMNNWDKIIDLKLIYMPEYDEYFEIDVDCKETNENVKSITAVSLGVSELSQTMLYDIEINTEDDIKRDNYTIAKVYDKENPSVSILGRILSKAPHYKIDHVDESISSLVRQFSVSDNSIYDFLTNDFSDELNCLVKVKSNRRISVYDLLDYCRDCGNREENMNICSKCNSSNIKKGYGKNTTIKISTNNIASEISNSSDKDSIKNTFRVQGGDDLINAAIRACNPNGTEYINRFSEDTINDMSIELKNALNGYNSLYDSFVEDYHNCMLSIYNTMDKILYLTSEMMPTPTLDGYTSESELALLTKKNLSPISVQDLKYSGISTVNNAVSGVLPIFLHSGFKAEIIESVYTTGDTIWKGRFKVTNTTIVDEDDPNKYAETPMGVYIELEVNDDYTNFIKQKLEKILSKESLIEIQDIENDDDFKEELKKYCKNRLSSFSDAYQSCLEVLAGIGAAEPTHEFYDSIYKVYYNRKVYIDDEILVREQEIKEQEDIQNEQIVIRDDIQSKLNLESYLNNIKDGLYLEYCSYRREDTYKNDNYISDGLSNSELLQKAEELIKVAKKEIYKASETQYSITTTIGNLFSINSFLDIQDDFIPGNWIRIETDETLYKLRLLNYTIRQSEISQLPCELSNVLKISSGISDVESVLSSAKTMATSFESVKHQSKSNEEYSKTVESWVSNGLDTSNVAIKNSDNQTVLYDKHGILCREYDDLEERYSDEQLKIINNIIAITDNNWESVKTALGHYYYKDSITGEQKSAYGLLAETIIGRFILGETLKIINNKGTLSFDDNGLIVTNGTNKLIVNPNEENGKIITLLNGAEEIVSIDNNGNAIISGEINAKSGTFSGNITSTATITGGKIQGSEIATSNFIVTKDGDVKVDGDITCLSELRMSIYGNKYAIIKGNAETEKNALEFRGIDDEMFLKYSGKYSGGEEPEKIFVLKNMECLKNFVCSGTKNRVIDTNSYNKRLQYCYETPTPMFGDVGEGVLDEDGICYVYLDEIFAETIDTDCTYQVFLQKYGSGDCFIEERNSSYFIVKGTPNMHFGWELKAVQKGYDTTRLEEYVTNNYENESPQTDLLFSYLDDLVNDFELEELNE